MRCAVLGDPIGHSLSPVLHRAAYADLGLDWTYRAIRVASGGLSDFLSGLDDSWRGLSLTMPLKREVIGLLTDLDDTARVAGVANTVILGADGSRSGANTDIPGVLAALTATGVDRVETVTVLGGGATAVSVLLGVSQLGCRRATLAVREPSRAEETVQAVAAAHPELEVEVVRLAAVAELAGPDLLVSTIPASAQVESVLGLAARSTAVFEVVYDPWPTPVMRTARRAGGPVVDGLDLLVAQAALQVELMTGRPGPVPLMRRAAELELERR